MHASSPAPLLSPDHGIDAARGAYPDTVTAVFGSLAIAAATDSPASEAYVQLAARSADALNEVAEWANTGLSADPTACAWLSYLRWARAAGARPPASSPVPPAREFDRDFPVLSRACGCSGDSFAALATGEFGEVARPIDPTAESGEVLARSIPYGLVPNLGWKALVPIIVDAAAITHGHAEAQTAAVGAALAIHASVRAQETDAGFGEVLTAVSEVCEGMTRPAPKTRALLHLVTQTTGRADLGSADGALSRALGDGTAASSGLALGLFAAGTAQAADGARSETVTQALEVVSAHPAASPGARSVAAAVCAARFGTQVVPTVTDPVGAELAELARRWSDRWRP